MIPTLQEQRGNVTLITAASMLLLVLVVVMGTAVSNQAGYATRMQAASDQAALTAAVTYMSVINDEVAFDIIDWGLGFIERMAEILEAIGQAIAAVPFLEGVGAAIITVAEFVQNAASTAKDFFDEVKNALNKILEAAKEILSIINATVAAANNGYLGFILPVKDVLQQAGQSRWKLVDVQKVVDHARIPLTDKEIQFALRAQAMHTIWGTPFKDQASAHLDPNCKNADGSACQVPSCTAENGTVENKDFCDTLESRLGSPVDNSRDIFSLNTTPAPGCTAPPLWTDATKPKPAIPAGSWHHPCDDVEWARDSMRGFYLEDELSLINLRTRLNIKTDANTDFKSDKPQLFDDEGKPENAKKAYELLTTAEKDLKNFATGNDPDVHKSVNAQVKLLHDYYEKMPATFPGVESDGTPGVFFPTPLGKNNPRVYCVRSLADTHPGFDCSGAVADKDADNCKPAEQQDGKPPPTEEQLFPCWNFWGWTDNNDFKDTVQKRRDQGPLPDNYPTDYRKTQFYSDEANHSKALGTWKNFKLVPSSAENIPDSPDVNEAFIMVSEVLPSSSEVLIRRLSGAPEQGKKWTITASKAIIHRADSKADAVHASSLCNNIPGSHDDSKLLGLFPKNAYGWCKVLLGAFDLFVDIYNGIHDFFYDGFINPLRNFSIDLPIVGTICPFCWLADIIAGLVDYVLGPAPPDARTFHVVLVTVGCVPAVQQISDIASNLDLEKIMKMVISDDASFKDADNNTCKAGQAA
ncbi:MAG: hypothetical protein QOE92_1575 [Chloroflexota bacterium]|jgi:hypothetical protein|nr:hypothetical protein [Chloroflexota bacterium]